MLFPGWFVEPMSNEWHSANLPWVLEPNALPAFLAREPRALADDQVRLAAYHLSRYARSRQAELALAASEAYRSIRLPGVDRIGGRMLSILISAAALAACYRPTVDPAECSNEPTADYPSSDGQWKSVAFLRQCGAGPIELQVSVLPNQCFSSK